VTIEEDTTVEPVPAALPANPAREPFAHASEAEMARILDFYAVTWRYEPHVFPILWNLSGDVIESFSPDFYLPDLDIYLEMTTLKQRLVRKKNRKLRRLKELYPDIRIKLFYARDFRALMLKYGKLALVESLSGSLGQVVPDRSADAMAASAEAPTAADSAGVASKAGPTRRSRAAAGHRAPHRAEAGPAR
jgi:hypoxanthine phosphoribosyltransferase